MVQVPVISVVIVSWNAKRYLQECLESLFGTPCRFSIEVFVVDNASTDGSPDMVAEAFSQVRLIRNKENLGFAKANNIGIRNSSGTFLCLVNSDVNILEGCMDTLTAFMQSHPSVGIAGPRMLNAQGKVGRSCRGFPSVWNMFCNAIGLDLLFPNARLFGGYVMRFWPQNTSRPVDILGGWFWIVRRSALDQVGLLDENFFFYAEDMDWCKRFRINGWTAQFLSEAASIHYGGGSSTSAPLRYYIQQQRADLRYWRKHHSLIGGWSYYCVCIIHQGSRAIAHGLIAPFSSKREEQSAAASRSWQCLLWFLKGAK